MKIQACYLANFQEQHKSEADFDRALDTNCARLYQILYPLPLYVRSALSRVFCSKTLPLALFQEQAAYSTNEIKKLDRGECFSIGKILWLAQILLLSSTATVVAAQTDDRRKRMGVEDYLCHIQLYQKTGGEAYCFERGLSPLWKTLKDRFPPAPTEIKHFLHRNKGYREYAFWKEKEKRPFVCVCLFQFDANEYITVIWLQSDTIRSFSIHQSIDTQDTRLASYKPIGNRNTLGNT